MGDTFHAIYQLSNLTCFVQAAIMKQGADVAHAIDRRVASELECAHISTLPSAPLAHINTPPHQVHPAQD